MTTAPDGILAVVPVKEFALAKQRLAGAFTPAFRRLLAQAMLCDVMAALAEARGLAGFAVISADPQAGRLAQDFGGQWLVEREVRGLNAAVTQAAAMLSAQGRPGMLVLPGDIPAIAAPEVEALIAGHGAGAAVSLVPAADGQGTNALLATPPDLLAFAYGPGSFARHVANARRVKVEPRATRLAEVPGIACDLDQPEDIGRLAPLPMGSHTRRILDGAGVDPGGYPLR